MDLDVLDEVHMCCVTTAVQFANSFLRTRIIENSQCTHFISNDDFSLADSSDHSHFVLPTVGGVDFLSIGADTYSISLPLDAHFNKDGIDFLVVLEVDHPKFLEAVFEK